MFLLLSLLPKCVKTRTGLRVLLLRVAVIAQSTFKGQKHYALNFLSSTLCKDLNIIQLGEAKRGTYSGNESCTLYPIDSHMPGPMSAKLSGSVGGNSVINMQRKKICIIIVIKYVPMYRR